MIACFVRLEQSNVAPASFAGCNRLLISDQRGRSDQIEQNDIDHVNDEVQTSSVIVSGFGGNVLKLIGFTPFSVLRRPCQKTFGL